MNEIKSDNAVPKGYGVTFSGERKAKGDYKKVPFWYNVVCPSCTGELNEEGVCVLCNKKSKHFVASKFIKLCCDLLLK